MSLFGDICEFEYIRIPIADTFTKIDIDSNKLYSLKCLEDISNLAKGKAVYFKSKSLNDFHGMVVHSDIVKADNGYTLFATVAVEIGYEDFVEKYNNGDYIVKTIVKLREVEYIEPITLEGHKDRILNGIHDIYGFVVNVNKSEDLIYNETKDSLKPCPFCGKLPEFKIENETVSGLTKYKGAVFCNNQMECHVLPSTKFCDSNYQTVCKMVAKNWNDRKEV